MTTERLLPSKIAAYQRFRRQSFASAQMIRAGHKLYAAGDREAASRACNLAFLKQNDAWSKFCRRLLVASALGFDGFSGGHGPAPGISSEADVMSALNIRVPWKDDRKWHVANDFLGAARTLKVANIGTLNGSIGSTPNPSEQIRYVRNFFAHANPHTHERAFNACSQRRPVDFCFTSFDNGELVCVNWFGELDTIARLASD